MEDVNRMLNSVGKKIFVDHYYEFKDLNISKDLLAKKLLEENPNSKKLSGQLIRISFARKIFANNLQKEALEIILNSNRLDEKTIKKAEEIIEREFN
ncbi:hypothetical protein [Anaerosalibacter bizertensis]|uniref:hypothetical protein n=1 Tax=Anaerosalibacter bizertensis TaxID=932217 RepID=UPI0035198B61